MKLKHIFYLSSFGIKTLLWKQRKPILGTIILTDRCNLTCKHCAVNNIHGVMYPYKDIRQEMEQFYREGIRILFFCGGESLMWQDQGKTVKDLVREAKEIGFFIVNVVTNGTMDLDIPGTDILFLSIDGLRETHNLIRGDTFDRIMENVERAQGANICIYMAINSLNVQDVVPLAQLVKDHPSIRSISFNFHTPYEGTEYLSLTREQKVETIEKIKGLIKGGYPVFNLYHGLDAYLQNQWSRPCYQCIVSENNQRFVCGRCVEIDGLCGECGYLFAVEFSLLFQGNRKIIWEVLKTYLKYA